MPVRRRLPGRSPGSSTLSMQHTRIVTVLLVAIAAACMGIRETAAAVLRPRAVACRLERRSRAPSRRAPVPEEERRPHRGGRVAAVLRRGGADRRRVVAAPRGVPLAARPGPGRPELWRERGGWQAALAGAALPVNLLVNGSPPARAGPSPGLPGSVPWLVPAAGGPCRYATGPACRHDAPATSRGGAPTVSRGYA